METDTFQLTRIPSWHPLHRFQIHSSIQKKKKKGFEHLDVSGTSVLENKGNKYIIDIQYSGVCVSCFSVWLFATLWTVAHQAPLSMEFSWQRKLGWVAILFFRGSSDPGIWPVSDVSSIACRFFTTSDTWKAHSIQYNRGEACGVAGMKEM